MTTSTQTPAKTHPGHTLKTLLESNKAELASVLPKHLTIDRLIKVALYAYAKVPLLQACTMESVVSCIKSLAELGLEPGGALGHAYLVPFNDKRSGTTICTLIIGYRGFIELARRSGRLSQIEAHVVHANDSFEIEFGLEPRLRHAPKLSGDRGNPVAVYCVARLADGAKHVEVMEWSAVQAVKARSRSANSGPWVTDELEMARKTVVRRAAKYLPLSAELAKAFDAEGEEPEQTVALPPGALAPPALPEQSATSKAKAAVARKLHIEEPVPAAPPSPPTVNGAVVASVEPVDDEQPVDAQTF